MEPLAQSIRELLQAEGPLTFFDLWVLLRRHRATKLKQEEVKQLVELHDNPRLTTGARKIVYETIRAYAHKTLRTED